MKKELLKDPMKPLPRPLPSRYDSYIERWCIISQQDYHIRCPIANARGSSHRPSKKESVHKAIIPHTHAQRFETCKPEQTCLAISIHPIPKPPIQYLIAPLHDRCFHQSINCAPRSSLSGLQIIKHRLVLYCDPQDSERNVPSPIQETNSLTWIHHISSKRQTIQLQSDILRKLIS